MVIFLLGCSASNTPTPLPGPPTTIDTFTCEAIALLIDAPACINAANGIMVQADDSEQATLTTATVNITFNGTIYIAEDSPAATVTFLVLERNSVVGISEQTRVVQGGWQLQLTSGEIISVEPYNVQFVSTLPTNALPRRISPLLINDTRPTLRAQPTTQPACEPITQWAELYTVQRGDTLSAIAARYNLDLATLQETNCITNPNRLSPDDILRIPGEPVDQSVTFTADPETISNGDCITLTWAISGSRVAYLMDETINNEGARTFCPDTTTTYTLNVSFEDGSQSTYTQTITVTDAEE